MTTESIRVGYEASCEIQRTNVVAEAKKLIEAIDDADWRILPGTLGLVGIDIIPIEETKDKTVYLNQETFTITIVTADVTKISELNLDQAAGWGLQGPDFGLWCQPGMEPAVFNGQEFNDKLLSWEWSRTLKRLQSIQRNGYQEVTLDQINRL